MTAVLAVSPPPTSARWPVGDYLLAATLHSGQAFRWQEVAGWHEGVVNSRWVRLRQRPGTVEAETAEPVPEWTWLEHYLQLGVNLEQVLASFPIDPALQEAVHAWRGLRLLRQDPWECLASFVLSSTKQIQQIRQIVARLCVRYGAPVRRPEDRPPAYAFPTAAALAACSEANLRECGMGFRARYLKAVAQAVATGHLPLETLRERPLSEARAALEALPGVGRKIADCVLLFALGYDEVFPVDVWVMRVLGELYFPTRRPPPRKVYRFVETHFGPYAGYAQQYLFHHRRLQGRRPGPGVQRARGQGVT